MSLAENKRAGFDYELLEKFEAGLELRGFEVKAIRAGKMTLSGAHIIVRGGEAYLVGATIQPYQPNNTPNDFDPSRSLRLLLTKKELGRLASAESQAGLTIIPLSVYNKGQRLKVSLALARRRKKFDKRETTKKRETDRERQRTLKRF